MENIKMYGDLTTHLSITHGSKKKSQETFLKYFELN